MEIYRPRSFLLEESILAIGAFDGVHLGHQSIIEKLVKRSEILKVPSIVYTFTIPPRVHFQNAVQLISLEEKMNNIAELGVDYAIVAELNSHYLNQNANTFIQEISLFHPKEIIVGSDFRFGKNRAGRIQDLQKHFNVDAMEKVCCKEGKIISSTRIRGLLSEGYYDKAQSLLKGNC